MKKNLFWQLLTLVAVAVPGAYQWAVWPSLPAQVPTHFHNEQANGFTSRGHLWLLTLALPLGVALLMAALPYLDPKRRLDGRNANYLKLRLALVGLVSGLACLCLYVAVHPGTSPGRGLAVMLGGFFALMGNYLTTVQPNYFVGIRTPWTLESPTVWARTHRVGGALFFVAGLLLAGLALVLPLAALHPLLLALVLGSSLFAYAYSYVAFRQEQRLKEPA